MASEKITLGAASYCATPPYITPGVKVSTGKFVSISTDFMVIGGEAQHPPVKYRKAVSSYPFKEQCRIDYHPCEGRGDVVIGNDVWIGKNVTMFDGLTIGDGAIIGACTVVTKDVPAYAVYVGNPGRVKKYRFPTEQIEALLRIKWWDFEDINGIISDLKDVDEFIKKYDISNNA